MVVIEPHQLSENICFLQLGRTLLCQQRLVYLWNILDGLHVGVQLVVEATFQSPTLSTEFARIE